MIAIVDYGAGNLRSIERALTLLGEPPTISGDPNIIAESDAIVFPGVGNARAAMDQLNNAGISDALTDAATRGKPVLGVCLGMQLLFEDQEEGPTTGLGLLKGTGVKMPEDQKTPHMGWNTVRYTDHGPFAGQPDGVFYFVHSYMVRPEDSADVAGITGYGTQFPSVIVRDNIWGTQFHPEKSGDLGIALLQQWVSYIRNQTTP